MWLTYLEVLLVILAMGVLTWVWSYIRSDVSVVDSLWSLMFLMAAALYAWQAPEIGLRGLLVLMLVLIWSLRLSIHLTVRNWGEPEDRRYQQIRRNNEPYFKFKSLYIVFGLQGVLAWVISIPLLFSLYIKSEFHWLDYFAMVLWTVGFLFESIADYQLLRFRHDAANRGKVLDTGLWRYTRHPNYFGECCIWWSFYLMAIPSGGWWTIYAPVLMSLLLLRVSGVGLMEKDIGKRRPEYQAYIERTNAFFPGRPKEDGTMMMKELRS